MSEISFLSFVVVKNKYFSGSLIHFSFIILISDFIIFSFLQGTFSFNKSKIFTKKENKSSLRDNSRLL